MKRALSGLALIAVLVLPAIQAIRPAIPTGPAGQEIRVSANVRAILQKDCYSCHSNDRKLAWFDEISPGYWIVRHDILSARSALNFSTLGSAPPAVQKAKLFEAVNMIQLGAMPLPQFTALHPDAKVTTGELAELKSYLAPWNEKPVQSQDGITSGRPASNFPAQPEFNGVQFDPTFKDWALLSATDRGDNNTFRFVLGNDVAVKAVQAGNISPWPDGARFAKIAWEQETSADGLVHPGKFVQIELMVKDARRYRQSDGWGWGRWRGIDLKPYGQDANFLKECTGCHLPVRGNDYVYTLPIANAHLAKDEVVNNRAAMLPSTLPGNPFSWRPITMLVDRRARTMATLYGNNAARPDPARQSAANPPVSLYPAGSVLALVTWAQRDDPHWFGARIPDKPLSVEFVQISDAHSAVYRVFGGNALVEMKVDAKSAAVTREFILNLKQVAMP